MWLAWHCSRRMNPGIARVILSATSFALALVAFAASLFVWFFITILSGP